MADHRNLDSLVKDYMFSKEEFTLNFAIDMFEEACALCERNYVKDIDFGPLRASADMPQYMTTVDHITTTVILKEVFGTMCSEFNAVTNFNEDEFNQIAAFPEKLYIVALSSLYQYISNGEPLENVDFINLLDLASAGQIPKNDLGLICMIKDFSVVLQLILRSILDIKCGKKSAAAFFMSVNREMPALIESIATIIRFKNLTK